MLTVFNLIFKLDVLYKMNVDALFAVFGFRFRFSSVPHAFARFQRIRTNTVCEIGSRVAPRTIVTAYGVTV